MASSELGCRDAAGWDIIGNRNVRGEFFMTQCPLILISDDDPVVHESLGLYLDNEGYEHISAYDGDEVDEKL